MIARFAHMAERIFDWIKYRVGGRIHSDASLMIIPYVGYGSERFIDLKGRVLEDKGIKPSKETDRIWDNLLNMYRRFESDEVPNARLLARFQDNEQEVDADEEGFFEVSLHLEEPLSHEPGWQKIDLELLDPRHPGNDVVAAEGQVMVVSPQAEYGVISDIDDTTVQVTKAAAVPAREAWLYENAEALSAVKEGLKQAKDRDFVKPPKP